MRRFLSVFLLLLLPLQFAIAAAAPYCALEETNVAPHFGHHDHPDAPAPEPVDEGDGKAKVDDCGVCHLSGAQILPLVAATPAFPTGAPLQTLPDARQPHHQQQPTERPPRSSLA